ncbi:MAG TPA: hypothetical protein VF173_11710 [Thermoanaerobaculia bacterium]|nr:hypothetical protein [Thermoanaerobaculia bacterium]
MMKRARWFLLLAAGWALSWWLVWDGFTFRLLAEDPSTGRERGCYTAIELWLGVKEPTWIRGAEEIVGAVLFLGIPPLLIWSVRRALRRRSSSAGAEV